jgi:hypothetical protein
MLQRRFAQGLESSPPEMTAPADSRTTERRIRNDCAPSRKREAPSIAARRTLPPGTTWSVALNQIPALLELIDEQQIPVDISLTQGAATVSLHSASVYCRRCAQSVKLEGPRTSVQIDLDRLVEACAVTRASGARRRTSLRLVAERRTAFLTITGPTPEQGLPGRVWQLVMESLLPANLGHRSLKASAAQTPDTLPSGPA